MTIREEIWEELGNLAEFGEQDEVTDKILKIFTKLIDSIEEPGDMNTDETRVFQYAILKMKEELKK